MANSISI